MEIAAGDLEEEAGVGAANPIFQIEDARLGNFDLEGKRLHVQLAEGHLLFVDGLG